MEKDFTRLVAASAALAPTERYPALQPDAVPTKDVLRMKMVYSDVEFLKVSFYKLSICD